MIIWLLKKHGTTLKNKIKIINRINLKLKDNDIITIRNLYKTNKYTHRKLGNIYKVDHSYICRIINNKSGRIKNAIK